MSLVLFATLVLVIGIIAAAAFVVIGSLRTRGNVARSLQMVLFSFSLPRFSQADQQQQRSDNELIAVMEQLYASVATLHTKGWNKLVYGDPYIALEMSVQHVGEQISFYIAVPAKFADSFERQVQGLFPTAEVQRTDDYSIFNPNGAAAGAVLQLKHDPILPLRTYTDLEADPLGPIVGALGRLEHEGEGATVQVIVRASSNTGLRKLAMKTARYMQGGESFDDALKHAKHPPKKDKDETEKGVIEPPKVATEFESQVIKALQSKASHPLFDCNIRLLTSAATEERADQMLDDVVGSFAQFTGADLNALKVKKLKGKALERLVFRYAFRLFERSRAVQLSSEEVTGIFHFPVSSAVLPKVKFAEFKTAEPPPNLPTEGIAFGENEYHGVKTPLRLSRDDRRRHMYIIGQTGTGKSVTMQSMMVQDMANGEGITYIDPHGPDSSWVLKNIPKERADDVIYFNPGDISHPIGLNLLEIDPSNPQEKTLVIDELFEIMNKLYDLRESGGPQFERYFKNATFLLLDNYERRVPTLADMSRVFVDDDFRNDLLAHETNPIVKQFWEQEATKMTGDQALVNFSSYITSKIDAFTSNDFLRPIINQKKSDIDFKDVIENKRILVVNMAKGKIGDLNADLLGMVILNKLRRVALARDMSQGDLPDHYAYIDEFQNVTTESMGVILSEARKFRLCLIMAHQFIKQLEDSIAGAVFGNVGTMLFYRISSEDAEDPRVKTKLEPVFSPNDVVNLGMGHAYVTMLVNGQVARPTSSRGMYAEYVKGKGDAHVMQTIIEMSRLKYGRPREEVEAEIRARWEKK